MAVIGLVTFTLSTAGFADFCAYSAKVPDVLAAPGHCSRCSGADVCAIHIERNALRHHLDVIFFQTGRRAMIALPETIEAGFYTVFVLVGVGHDLFLEQVQ